MKELNLSETKRDKLRKELAKKETDFIRIRRMRLTQHSFDTVAVIGRGAFGEVPSSSFSFSFLFFPNPIYYIAKQIINVVIIHE